jgi:hypothetical protein
VLKTPIAGLETQPPLLTLTLSVKPQRAANSKCKVQRASIKTHNGLTFIPTSFQAATRPHLTEKEEYRCQETWDLRMSIQDLSRL